MVLMDINLQAEKDVMMAILNQVTDVLPIVKSSLMMAGAVPMKKELIPFATIAEMVKYKDYKYVMEGYSAGILAYHQVVIHFIVM